VQSWGTSGSEHIGAKNWVGAKVERSLSSESVLVEEFEHHVSGLVGGPEATDVGQGIHPWNRQWICRNSLAGVNWMFPEKILAKLPLPGIGIVQQVRLPELAGYKRATFHVRCEAAGGRALHPGGCQTGMVLLMTVLHLQSHPM